MKTVKQIFILYRNQGAAVALWTALRLFILPFVLFDKSISPDGQVVEIGCGNGVLSNCLTLMSKKRNVIGYDLSDKRINQAIKSVGKRKNIKFIKADVTKIKIPNADYYLICDVLHHISYSGQYKLLKAIINGMKKQSVLIIKDVDPSNKLPFLFGHIVEKCLYPKEKITTRRAEEWRHIFKKLGLTIKESGGKWYFPDSTIIFTLSKNAANN